MKARDLFIALLVVIVWGANFTVIKLGLDGVPSMLLVSFRYILVIIPGILFIKKPHTSWKYIILYGLTAGVGQFGCLFYALSIGMPAGLASIIVQLQAFMTPFFAAFLLNERLRKNQIIGFVIGALGLGLIGYASLSSGLASIPIPALLLTIGAPTFWSLSSIVSKKAHLEAKARGEDLDMLGLVVWSALVPPIPMLVLSLIIDGPAAIIASLSHLSFMSIFSALYIGYLATLFGYGFWNILTGKYSLAKFAPLSLLVPVTGLLTAYLVLGENLSLIQWLGAGIILLGLIISNMKDIEKARVSP